ncbi:PLP-dependent aminotransferase family protein [Anaerosacchariphilus sp. NSJ-68]|uniref:PLP-dependent aminotransferase family protein n=2 Tax=Lachnospiraceae TaxID=186803 RepID=A0A923LCP5_9FIRM|nr:MULTISPECIES: PLP-dependent aminotransferase family protein [Lachnospiraceae]MBC5659750.1 PLP-dependent aminotransferase family protein [Anaerosacchariphilus hominis]MBC5697416.1 PLP-dependent aminotransferase family protein [Roseburia difficilis]
MRELTMELHTEAETPLYEQIYDYIKQEIQNGKILAGEKLPSSRVLSAYLEVSRSTVDLAYGQLVSEGYIEAIPCKGYFACQVEGLYRLHAEPAVLRREEKQPERVWRYDFTPNGIDLDSFPYSVWRKVTRNVLLDDRKELFQLGDPKGEWELRETICTYLHQARGVNCSPEQVILGAGNDYLMMLLSAVLGKRRIAMESPTYRHAYRLFEQLGQELRTVPVDASGMQVESLRQSGADVAYVMPSHQYPLGIVMPIKRRLELLKWAAEGEERYLIEDDYDSEFRYRGKPIPALQGADQNDTVIYIGTFSKSIAPAIRISYLVLPERLLQRLGDVTDRFSSTVSRIDQMILNSFIKEGHYERHLNRMRALYGHKQEILVGELKKRPEICTVRGEDAGVHLLVEFENGMTEEEAIRRAEELRIRIYPLSEYRAGEAEEKPGKPTVLLGYATLTEQELEKAAGELLRVWETDSGAQPGRR